ncbi:MAG: fatty acid desaturase, partial [Boseongicola sp.]
MSISDSNLNMIPPATVPVVGEQPIPEQTLVEEPIAIPGKFTDKLYMLAAVFGPFVGFIAAVVHAWRNGWMGWGYVALFLVAWAITGMGITIGFHRLLTHNAFETHRFMRALWTIFGALSVEGSPLVWCAVHRKHHAKSDKRGDPHSPHVHGEGIVNRVRGFWFAHAGWLFTGHWSYPDLERYVPDLLEDKLLVAVDRMYYLWVLISLAIPTAIAGLVTMTWEGAFLGFLWGGVVRVFLGHHITWSINSVCHVFGRRP